MQNYAKNHSSIAFTHLADATATALLSFLRYEQVVDLSTVSAKVRHMRIIIEMRRLDPRRVSRVSVARNQQFLRRRYRVTTRQSDALLSGPSLPPLLVHDHSCRRRITVRPIRPRY